MSTIAQGLNLSQFESDRLIGFVVACIGETEDISETINYILRTEEYKTFTEKEKVIIGIFLGMLYVAENSAIIQNKNVSDILN